MCSETKIILLVIALVSASCGPFRRVEEIRRGDVAMTLSVADEPEETVPEKDEVVIDSIKGTLSDGPLIMKAIKDTETGEMVATDVIQASKVVARFRNVAERAGYVSICFDVTVPQAMASSKWQLKIFPFMKIQQDSVGLEPVYITGELYRRQQLRGYERYKQFLSSIITDPDDFLRIRQLEIFLQRHFPETYAMRTDSSYVSDYVAENLFGVTQRDAFEHYRRDLRWRMNERRKGRTGEMFSRYVKDPIPSDGVRLDTVLVSSDGDFIYRYTHTFRSRPRLKKVHVSLDGQLYEGGECIASLPFPDELTFYISSLSSLTDDLVKYRMFIRQRRVHDHTKAFIDFAHGSSEIDTLLGDNASELLRVRRCIDDVLSREEYALDSLVVVASCSPEGSYRLNSELSVARSRAVSEYIGGYVPEHWRDSIKASSLPENWDQFLLLVEHDTLIGRDSRLKMISLVRKMEGGPDRVEQELSCMPEYRYLREKVYPKLRNVRFDFHLHRVGMVQDTVMTTELDTAYMAGLQALRDLDYKKAVTLLRPYDDYNSALAFVCADYNHSALDVLDRQDLDDPRVCYLKSMVLSRLGLNDEALKYFELALARDPALEHRANLDPEMHEIVKLRQKEDL
ncbi:MAG: hypothetical protein J5976_02135 [Bacteroidales bacterium]|nr:hypothetical protein [Bacteroidales bacterium]